ncbi:MAG TPA: UDP-3-O-(3-hydroxymyristoyl)glucosamine N-acyltransferase [Rhodocyclaceae bacterium]
MGERRATPGYRLSELAARLGGTVVGDDVLVSCVAPLESADAEAISFLANPKFRRHLDSTQAGAIIIAPKHADATSRPRILHDNPYACYARVVALLNPPERPAPGAHPTAVIGSAVPASAAIGAGAVIGTEVEIGECVVIGANAVIGNRVVVGEGSFIDSGVVVRHDCRIGQRAIIHSGAVIGADGFGFAKDGDDWVKIPQVGRVVIGDDVEIGACTSIDRGALDDTRIGNGVKLDNQIQIAHNVTIGDYTAIAGCVGIAGSTKIGARCTIGGAAMIIGHLELCDGVHVSAGTLISKSIRKPGHYTGVFPVDSHESWLHNAAQLRNLDALAKRVRELENRLQQLEQS